jgi:hypothetical protein
MGCCGDKRRKFYENPTNQEINEPAMNREGMRLAPKMTVFFEYTGRTGLTVKGPITGQIYRFNQPGATVAVDGRDGPSIEAVPNLRPVKNDQQGNSGQTLV